MKPTPPDPTTQPTQTQPSPETTRSVIIERTFPHPPEKLWRALTESPLIAEWLMSNDFAPIVGRPFQLRSQPVPNWDGLIHCRVLLVDPPNQLSYTWSTLGLDTTVLFTLTPAPPAGHSEDQPATHLRMEHSGFPATSEAAFKGATYGWQRFLTTLETLLNRPDTPEPADNIPEAHS